MYNDHFGLKENPFSIQPDPTFLYPSKRHAMAMAMLEYGIEHRAGFIAITGAIGSGKTTLIRQLLNKISDDVTVGLIANTAIGASELLSWVLHAFAQPFDSVNKVVLFDQLQRFLIEEYSAGRRAVLIIDEAQNLKPEVLEELRLLSNINADKHQLLQQVLVGQPELRDLLRRPELAQFSQRISVDFHIPPLGEEETRRYIHHRLAVAGRTAPLFEKLAIVKIFQATAGVPRNINILCDTVMVYGLAAGSRHITAVLVDEVLADRAEHGIFGSHKA